SFLEKPDQPEPIPGSDNSALCSMGIYVFNTSFLFEQLIKDADMPNSSHDFGKDIIPAAIEKYRVFAFPFRDVQSGKQSYWRDVGTVDAFWAANLELIGVTPELNLYDNEWPIWTFQEQLPPAKFIFDEDNRRGMAVDSLVSGGCIISGATIRHSLLFSNVYVNDYSYIEASVLLPEVTVGKNCSIKNAVIDKGCEIPDGMQIGENREDDEKRFSVTPNGVILVTPEMLGQQLHYVR
ncbi:MAG: sugar phosphate nucleotidyltransferase, partial [Gammaproteobacteria bacterium]